MSLQQHLTTNGYRHGIRRTILSLPALWLGGALTTLPYRPPGRYPLNWASRPVIPTPNDRSKHHAQD
jgi:hypothetical protein